MKQSIIVTVLALVLSACAHETTTMDRELALKLVDSRNKVEVVQSAPPVFNVSFNNQGGTQNAEAQHGPWEKYANQGQSDSVACSDTPIYGPGGVLMRMEKRCYGGN